LYSLKSAVIHSLEKKARQTTTTVKYANGHLDVKDTMVLKLAKQLGELVGKDGNSVLWGQFATANREGDFPGAVRTLMQEQFSLSSFMAMSEITMKELREQAEKKTGATGGHIFFGQYYSNGADFLLVAMIKQKGASTLALRQKTKRRLYPTSRVHPTSRVQKIRPIFALLIARGARKLLITLLTL
jgi:nucleoid-associated protein